jgi:hypothetical protein
LTLVKSLQCLQPACQRHTGVAGGEQGGDGVVAIVQPAQLPARAADQLAGLPEVQAAVAIAALSVPAGSVVETLDRRPATASEHPFETAFGGVRDDQAGAWQGAHEMVKLRLDRRQVGKDVGMIELQVVQDRRPRAVVHELRALVAEGGIVLVGLYDEERRLPEFAGQTRRNAEVQRHATDQEAGAEARVFEDPGKHGGGRRLAVRAGDRQNPALPQHVLGEPLRTGDEG